MSTSEFQAIPGNRVLVPVGLRRWSDTGEERMVEFPNAIPTADGLYLWVNAADISLLTSSHLFIDEWSMKAYDNGNFVYGPSPANPTSDPGDDDLRLMVEQGMTYAEAVRALEAQEETARTTRERGSDADGWVRLRDAHVILRPRPVAITLHDDEIIFCPSGCGCRKGSDDADRLDCACDGPCTMSTELDWDAPVEDHRDAALAAIRRLHRPVEGRGMSVWCRECEAKLPCPTLRAIDDASATTNVDG